MKGKATIATLQILTSYAPSWVLLLGVISNEALFILVDGSGMRGGCLGGWMDSPTLEEMKLKRTSATLQIFTICISIWVLSIEVTSRTGTRQFRGTLGRI
jgi:hypothetical protein